MLIHTYIHTCVYIYIGSNNTAPGSPSPKLSGKVIHTYSYIFVHIRVYIYIYIYILIRTCTFIHHL